MRLTKDMFRTYKVQPGPFGLRHDQMVARAGLLNNAGWYNAQGEYLGHGDIGVNDLLNVSAGLEDGEFFMVMEENGWRYKETVACKGGATEGEKFYMELGADYVAANCVMIVTRGAIHCVKAHYLNRFRHYGIDRAVPLARELVACLLTPDISETDERSSYDQLVRDLSFGHLD